ncbi:hypothetical protein [Ramlibacter agri]|uniref:hypothetical protein n=1 Tax=Ramlibacter agri TaxID=2728837 RepID=UPI00146F38D6|nr:hypothetical protein [Ramlibacter agri]
MSPSSFSHSQCIEGEGRDSETSRRATRALVLRLTPWLILVFWTVLTVTAFQ